jgi:hypothetical protein
VGLKRIIAEKDFGSILRHAGNVRRWQRIIEDGLRGWGERDVKNLENALADPRSYDGGIIKLTQKQFRALEERNRRVVEGKPTVKVSPLLVWVEGRGLFPAVRKD